MREIKFRAYDKLEKRMCKVVSLHWQDDKLVAVKVDGEAEPLPIEGRFVIEQYTGLKDKNGNEIFVNDIVEMHYFEQYAGPGEVEKTVMGVVGKDSMGSFTRVGDKKYYWLHYLEDAEYYGDAEYNEELELLGNIHENQELMEERI